MSLDRFFDWLGMVTGVAMIATLVGSPQTAAIVNSLASGIIGIFRTVMGRQAA